MTLVGAFASQLGVPSFIAKMVEKGPVAEKRRECCLSLLGADASSEDLRENRLSESVERHERSTSTPTPATSIGGRIPYAKLLYKPIPKAAEFQCAVSVPRDPV